jgi:hypothetical protein
LAVFNRNRRAKATIIGEESVAVADAPRETWLIRAG